MSTKVRSRRWRRPAPAGCRSSLFAILPQALPQFVTYNLYWFEVGVRSATVLGMVGAGGIGFELVTSIRLFEWREVGVVLLFILGMVTIIDLASTYIRSRIYESTPVDRTMLMPNSTKPTVLSVRGLTKSYGNDIRALREDQTST